MSGLSPRAIRTIEALEAIEFGLEGGNAEHTRDDFVAKLRNVEDVLTGADAFLAAYGDPVCPYENAACPDPLKPVGYGHHRACVEAQQRRDRNIALNAMRRAAFPNH